MEEKERDRKERDRKVDDWQGECDGGIEHKAANKNRENGREATDKKRK